MTNTTSPESHPLLKETLEEIGMLGTIEMRQVHVRRMLEVDRKTYREISRAVLINRANWHHAGLGGMAVD